MTQSQRDVVRKCVDLGKEDVIWFESTYPSGSFSWILSMLLHEFRTATANSPEDYAKLGAKALQEMLEAERGELT